MAVFIAGPSATAAAQGREPIVVIGLRPASGTLQGPSELRRLSEAQRLRGVADDAVRRVAHHPIIDDAGLRTTLGVEYLVDFMDCRGQVACVARLVAKLKKMTTIGVYGDYLVVNKNYSFRFRLIDLGKGKVVKEVEFKLDASDSEDRKLWQRELEPLLASVTAEEEPTPTDGTSASGPPTDGKAAGGTPAGGTPVGGTPAGGTPAGGTPAGGTPVGGTSAGGTPAGGTPAGGTPVGDTPAGGTPVGASPADGGAGSGGVPELEPISSDGGGGGVKTTGAAKGSSDAFIDNSVLDAISRGITWHGHFQNYTAMGARRQFSKKLIAFEDRLQLEFSSDINSVRVVGKPQFIFNMLDRSFRFDFREMFAARDYKRVDLAAGEQIVTWGVTDFWPVVDIVNPRNFIQLKNWRPIDEKLPLPMLQLTALFGRLTFHLIGVPALGRSSYQLDQTQPFALPIPAPPGNGIEQATLPTTLANTGGGARVDLALAAWKLSLYEFVGRDPIPSVHAELNAATPTKFIVDNDRVAMTAMSLQGNVDSLGTLVKAEAAFYYRLCDDCDAKRGMVLGIPECFYLRRVPTGRANLAIERHILPGLDAHLQFIPEYTRAKDVPRLPGATSVLAPGLPEQYTWNPIFTLRLQGDYKKSDFRPMAFIFWSLADEAWFVNTDLEYHLADGFALALGGFWFQGYATKPNKNKYTLMGSLAGSSNVYVRATAWF